jgi:hypothetical protein
MRISDEAKVTYAGALVLKLMDLSAEDGGVEFPAVLPPELAPLEPVFEELHFNGWVAFHKRKQRYELTKAGIAYVGELIDEAEALVDEFDEEPVEEVVAELKRRRLDPMRARFLWGWYEGEFDDLVLFQQRRGTEPVERLWAYYLMDDAFYDEIAQDLTEDED